VTHLTDPRGSPTMPGHTDMPRRPENAMRAIPLLPLHIGENRSRTWITTRATLVFDLTDEVEPPPAPWGYEDR
jgi:hypothetical protein